MAAADEFKASYIQACEAKNVKPRDELISVLNTAAATGYVQRVWAIAAVAARASSGEL